MKAIKSSEQFSSSSTTHHKSLSKQVLWLGYALLVLLSLIWGVSWPIMKVILNEVPPWTFRLYCMVFSGIGFILLIKSRGISLKIPRDDFKPLLISSFLNITLWFILSAYAIANMNASRASIIAYTMPICSALLSIVILKERMTISRFVSLFLGICGIAILIGPDIVVFKTAPLGALLMLIAAFSWGAGIVTIKYHKWTMPTIVLSCWSLIIGGIPLTIGAIIFETDAIFAPISFQCILGLVFVVILGNIVSFWAWYKVIDIFPATIASIGILMVPIIGVFSSSLMLGESVGILEITALTLVVSSLGIVTILPGFVNKKSIPGK